MGVTERDPATQAALQRYWAELRERGRARQRFEEGLIKDFELPDREKLIEFLSVAELSYEVALRDGPGGEWSLEEADELDALSSALWKTVRLLYSLERPLAIHLAGVTRDEQMEHYAEVREREREVRELA